MLPIFPAIMKFYTDQRLFSLIPFSWYQLPVRSPQGTTVGSVHHCWGIPSVLRGMFGTEEDFLYCGCLSSVLWLATISTVKPACKNLYFSELHPALLIVSMDRVVCKVLKEMSQNLDSLSLNALRNTQPQGTGNPGQSEVLKAINSGCISAPSPPLYLAVTVYRNTKHRFKLSVQCWVNTHWPHQW